VKFANARTCEHVKSNLNIVRGIIVRIVIYITDGPGRVMRINRNWWSRKFEFPRHTCALCKHKHINTHL